MDPNSAVKLAIEVSRDKKDITTEVRIFVCVIILSCAKHKRLVKKFCIWFKEIEF